MTAQIASGPALTFLDTLKPEGYGATTITVPGGSSGANKVKVRLAADTLALLILTSDIRDEDPANPSQGALRQLLHIIADQFGVLEEELQQLYENHFAETSAGWALPYIGELIGLPIESQRLRRQTATS